MSDAEILDLLDRATAYAIRMISCKSWRFGHGGFLPGGRSVEDLVQAAFENILNGGKWDENKPLWLVIQGFIRGTVGNLARSWENRKFSSIDEESLTGDECWRDAINSCAVDDSEPIKAINRPDDDDLFLKIVEYFEDGSPERQIAEFFLSSEGKRAEVLAATGLKAKEYEAAKKRLRRFLGKYRQEPAAAHQ